MSEQQIIIPEVQTSVAKVTDEALAGLLKTGDFLPYISIMGSNSDAVKEGKIGMGRIAIVVNQTPIDLGAEAVMVVITERAKAMRFGDNILSYFDISSDEFKKVQADASIPNSQAMAGLEFLVWCPGAGEDGMYAGLFCGSKSMKKEAPVIRKFLGGKAMTLKVQLLSNARYKWHSGVAVPCTTPIGVSPDPQELKEQLEKFLNPKSSTVEKANAPAEGARAR